MSAIPSAGSFARLVLRTLAALCLCANPSVRAAGVQVLDDSGATISLAAPARRIVSLAPHLTEQLFGAGAGAQVVGVVAYSDFPDAARRLPQVGDSAQLDLERIVALRPDLIVAWRSGSSALQLQRLEALGLPVYRNESRSLADIASTLRRLGELSGNRASAQAQAQRVESQVAALRARYANRGELRVFYQIWKQPLLTVNGAHMISQALTLCGARNIFAELSALTPSVNEEAVLAADPDAVVTGAVPGAGSDDLEPWLKRRGLRATRFRNLLHVNPDTLHRQSYRVVEGVAELCEKLDAARERLRAAAAPASAPAASPPPAPALKRPG
jgi:iron complex transport system substrate-binding protein